MVTRAKVWRHETSRGDTVGTLIAADDPLPWDLLHDGRIVAIAHDALTIRVDHLGREFVVRLHGLERLAWLPYGDRQDEPLITEPEAIVAAKPMIVKAEWQALGRTMIVWSSLGSLRLGYAGLELEGVTLDELQAQVQAYWQRWREHWLARGLLLFLVFASACIDGVGDPGASDDGVMSGDDAGPVLDLGGDEAGRCTKVDLLFVIDDSHSMATEQGVLIAAFPEFMASVRATLDTVDSYHIGVVTTDAYPFNAPDCRQPGALVTATGGADSSASECGPFGSGRFMTEDDAFEHDFACAARVGVEGSNDERPIEALLATMGSQHAPGCNAGFLRSDALLVVVIITDEEDDHTVVFDEMHGTPGDPADWFAAFEQAIGVERNAVMLLIAGGLPDNTCGLPVGVGAEDAPRLREFAGMFSHSVLGDVCAWSYAPVFQEAIDFVDRACEEFVPVP
jgi:hypothetical protein